MASSINASTSAGLVNTADTSGVLALQTNGTTAVSISAAQVVTLTNALPVASGGTGAATASAARTSLGLVIGTDVLAPTGSAASLTSFPTFNQNTTGNAATATALSTASGSAPSYSARAWVNFNGTGTVAIRASGNVSSVTDNGVGFYTVNFSSAMPDANFAATAINDLSSNGSWYVNPYIYGYNTGSVQYANYSSYDLALGSADCVAISIAVFR